MNNHDLEGCLAEILRVLNLNIYISEILHSLDAIQKLAILSSQKNVRTNQISCIYVCKMYKKILKNLTQKRFHVSLHCTHPLLRAGKPKNSGYFPRLSRVLGTLLVLSCLI